MKNRILTMYDMKLYKLLFDNKDIVFNYSKIKLLCWDDKNKNTNNIKQSIYKLKKVSPLAKHHIKTLNGIGYKWSQL